MKSTFNHTHTTGQFGPPYEAKKLITCVECIDEVLQYRYELLVKYGWTVWPWGNAGLDMTA